MARKCRHDMTHEGSFKVHATEEEKERFGVMDPVANKGMRWLTMNRVWERHHKGEKRRRINSSYVSR